MKISVSDYEDYLYDHYKEHGIDTSLFMKTAHYMVCFHIVSFPFIICKKL